MHDDRTVTRQDRNGNQRAPMAAWSVPGYTEFKTLGAGGFGEVVLARHDATGTLVAIKYMRHQLLADPQWPQLFRAEAQVLAALNDPNIVRLYEYVESPSGAAIVMELVDGVSLREILIHQGATTPEAALVVLRGSLQGLAAAHRHGVVHRDYKPENVLVDGNGASKLTDFGIAARTGEEAVAAGSLLYAPPEQFAGTPASPAGDVYAATATFYECLTGRPPFTGDTAERLLYQHMVVPVPLDPVPEPVRPLVTAGMAKEPGKRPADAATFVTALEAVAARAYGPDWAKRGRSHLGEVALLLAALWPSGGPAAVQGAAVEQVNLTPKAPKAPNAPDAQESRHLLHVWHVRHLLHLRHLRNGRNRRRLTPVKAVAGVAVVTAGAAAGVALTTHLSGHASASVVTLPSVAQVSPTEGSDMGGTIVTITGTRLARATLVTFGGVPGHMISDSDTQITVASPPSTDTTGRTVTAAAITADSATRITGTTSTGIGSVNIAVTTPAGVSLLSAAARFTYTAPPPAISGISPGSGSTGGGTTVSITGAGLANATEVRFGSATAPITADSNTQITVTSPAGTGTVPVTVTTAAGTSPPTAAGHYTYTTRPERTQLISFTAPGSAPAGSSAALSAKGGGSGNRIVFSVDRASGPGVCTVSGATVTYTLAGHLRHRRQPGRQRHLRGGPPGPADGHGHRESAVDSFTGPRLGKAAARRPCRPTAAARVIQWCSPRPGQRPRVCTVSGATVSYTAAGTCVIDANQAGNAPTRPPPGPADDPVISAGPQSAQSISFSPPAPGRWAARRPCPPPAAAPAFRSIVLRRQPERGGMHAHGSSTVVYTAGGTCVIDANQAGNASYLARRHGQADDRGQQENPVDHRDRPR